jgi:hypothetical protein
MTESTSARRTARKIRYHDHEWNRVVARARDCRMPPSRYVREVSLESIPRARRNRIADELILQLGRIGNNLNQLARFAHTTGELWARDELQSVLAEVLVAVRRIR